MHDPGRSLATRLRAAGQGSFPPFLLLYGALYGAFGTESPFLPSFLAGQGLSPAEIGIVLSAGTVVRLGAGPLAGLVADRHDATRLVLGLAAGLAGLLSFAYLAATSFWALLAVSMAHSVAIAALAPLADALAIAAASRERGFTYGWIRGAGSAAFMAGTLVSGLLVAGAGLSSIVVSSGGLFLLMALATGAVPSAATARPAGGADPGGGVAELLAIPPFRRLVVVVALVIGSHALNDAFAVIRWRGAGIGPGTVGILWSISVAAEIVVFVLLGRGLLERLGPANAATLAALAGVARWAVMAETTSVPVLALAQLTHGLTFALLHLAAMDLLARTVPEHARATAQTLYGTLGLGTASVLLTLASGWLFDRLGAGAFWTMSALCLAAVPLARGLGAGPEGEAGAGAGDGRRA